MVELQTKNPLVGKTFVFTPENTLNFAEVYPRLLLKICKVSISYDGTEATGTSIADGGEIVVSFDDRVIFPSGMCILFDCEEVDDKSECKNEEYQLDEDTKFAVVGDDGCIKGWVKFGDLLKKAKSLCELYGYENGIPRGHLTAGDRVLAVDDNCELKSIPASDLVCDNGN